MRTLTLLAALALAAAMPTDAQTIGELCDPKYAAADEGFANTFCNRTPEQMRRQLNKMFAANRMLFNPNAVALTPRDPNNQRWIELPQPPEGWELYLDRGVTRTHDVYSKANVKVIGAITVFYMRTTPSVDGDLRELHLLLEVMPYGYVWIQAYARFQGHGGIMGCISEDAPSERYLFHEFDDFGPGYGAGGLKLREGSCPEGAGLWQIEGPDMRTTLGTINWHIVEDRPFR